MKQKLAQFRKLITQRSLAAGPAAPKEGIAYLDSNANLFMIVKLS